MDSRNDSLNDVQEQVSRPLATAAFEVSFGYRTKDLDLKLGR